MSALGQSSSKRESYLDLDAYGLIGDCGSAALVSSTGRIDWLCWPSFDGPSLFGAILDPRAGTWEICPGERHHHQHRYLPGTNILQTTFTTRSGSAMVLDFMPMASDGERRQGLFPDHEVVRLVEGTSGEVELSVRCAPRPGFGTRVAHLRQAGGLGYRIEGKRQLAVLRSSRPLQIDPGTGCIEGRVIVRAGERLGFSLVFDQEAPAVLPPLGTWCSESLSRTVRWWRQWVARSTYDGPYRESVERSALLLKLLTCSPSGALIAAPTTSLPERIGAGSNWDYRFCWLRDASMTVRALFGLGFEAEADAFVGWLLNTTSLTAPRLEVVYDVFGRGLPEERILDHLRGFRDSRPVRVSNAAKSQLQLDVYGEVVDAAMALVEKGGSIDRTEERALIGLGRYVCESWRQPDEGIWEPRGVRVEHTHSRLLCWVALDRLLALQKLGHVFKHSGEHFTRERDAIRREIEGRGWNPALHSYVGRLDGSLEDMDATLLLIPRHGFEPAGSERMRGTHRRVLEVLGAGGGLLYRYPAADEGAFGICSFWEAEFLAIGGGTLEQAEAALQRVCSYANSLGLFGEEIDPATGKVLGNFPQAFTHVGLINAALALEDRRKASLTAPASLEARA